MKKKTVVILSVAGVILVGGIASAGHGGNNKTTGASTPKATAPEAVTTKAAQPKATTPKATVKPSAKPKPAPPKVVTFRVWGKAPSGALGPLDITYGSDSDNRKGTFRNGQFTATLPLKDDAMFYDVSAQLQGSGDIQCSVTVDGKTKTGHASGSYNICDAQLSSGFLGGWE